MPEHTFFTVLRGHPDEAELAVLTAVLLTVLGSSGQPAGYTGTTPASVRGAQVPGRASWGAARMSHRPAVSWSAP